MSSEIHKWYLLARYNDTIPVVIDGPVDTHAEIMIKLMEQKTALALEYTVADIVFPTEMRKALDDARIP